ncbi:MAG: hypothetical protein HC888_00455 [Candidatus Competibacteraceae bacterium]|nr:hypothetical protein [Candidatus Competibacteraceae bacterium]
MLEEALGFIDQPRQAVWNAAEGLSGLLSGQHSGGDIRNDIWLALPALLGGYAGFAGRMGGQFSAPASLGIGSAVAGGLQSLPFAREATTPQELFNQLGPQMGFDPNSTGSMLGQIALTMGTDPLSYLGGMGIRGLRDVMGGADNVASARAAGGAGASASPLLSAIDSPTFASIGDDEIRAAQMLNEPSIYGMADNWSPPQSGAAGSFPGSIYGMSDSIPNQGFTPTPIADLRKAYGSAYPVQPPQGAVPSLSEMGLNFMPEAQQMGQLSAPNMSSMLALMDSPQQMMALADRPFDPAMLNAIQGMPYQDARMASLIGGAPSPAQASSGNPLLALSDRSFDPSMMDLVQRMPIQDARMARMVDQLPPSAMQGQGNPLMALADRAAPPEAIQQAAPGPIQMPPRTGPDPAALPFYNEMASVGGMQPFASTDEISRLIAQLEQGLRTPLDPGIIRANEGAGFLRTVPKVMSDLESRLMQSGFGVEMQSPIPPGWADYAGAKARAFGGNPQAARAEVEALLSRMLGANVEPFARMAMYSGDLADQSPLRNLIPKTPPWVPMGRNVDVPNFTDLDFEGMRNSMRNYYQIFGAAEPPMESLLPYMERAAGLGVVMPDPILSSNRFTRGMNMAVDARIGAPGKMPTGWRNRMVSKTLPGTFRTKEELEDFLRVMGDTDLTGMLARNFSSVGPEKQAMYPELSWLFQSLTGG